MPNLTSFAADHTDRAAALSIIRNARVVGGMWGKHPKGCQLVPANGVAGYGIVNDESPTVAPEVYKSQTGAENVLKYLKANSSARGMRYVYSAEG